MIRRILAVALALGFASPVSAQEMGQKTTLQDYRGFPLGTTSNPLVVTGGSGGSGSSPSSPNYTAPAGVNIARVSCTLPAYSAGGNAVCTDSSGTQTTTACAANAACQIAAANASRKYAFASGSTPGASVSLGYTATVAPGNSRAVDGPSATGGQGGFYEWQSPPTNAIYAASATSGAVVVFEQGQ